MLNFTRRESVMFNLELMCNFYVHQKRVKIGLIDLFLMHG